MSRSAALRGGSTATRRAQQRLLVKSYRGLVGRTRGTGCSVHQRTCIGAAPGRAHSVLWATTEIHLTAHLGVNKNNNEQQARQDVGGFRGLS